MKNKLNNYFNKKDVIFFLVMLFLLGVIYELTPKRERSAQVVLDEAAEEVLIGLVDGS